MNIETPTVEALAALLAESGRDYLCVSRPGEIPVHVFFTGRFNDHTVVWNTRILPLQHDQCQHAAPRHFMEISQGKDNSLDLTLGLNLPAIDEPAIRKAIIMVRNYKRLKPGRHEWGEEDRFDSRT